MKLFNVMRAEWDEVDTKEDKSVLANKRLRQYKGGLAADVDSAKDSTKQGVRIRRIKMLRCVDGTGRLESWLSFEELDKNENATGCSFACPSGSVKVVVECMFLLQIDMSVRRVDKRISLTVMMTTGLVQQSKTMSGGTLGPGLNLPSPCNAFDLFAELEERVLCHYRSIQQDVPEDISGRDQNDLVDLTDARADMERAASEGLNGGGFEGSDDEVLQFAPVDVVPEYFAWSC